jgi:uncharacterized protein
MAFVGRRSQLRSLQRLLDRVSTTDDGVPGRAVLVRGRRRVGKSRLVEEFLERASVPALFYAATGRPVRDELRTFAEDVAASTLPGAQLFRGVELSSWDAALRLLGAAVGDGPCVVVLDELPYLTASDPGFEGTLQSVFDRDLSRRRVLLVGIGSDLAMMEQLNAYGRPFHQRATEMVVPPLSPAEVGTLLGLAPADAFDAYLVTGGLPLVCAEWPAGAGLWDYLASALEEPTSALLVSAERALAAEFPVEAQARTVLGVVGSGERTFTAIGREAGGLQQASLSRALRLLVEKRVVVADEPLSTHAGSKDKRYRVADPYLRFWLTFLGPRIGEVERGRGDRILARVRASWTSWRGRAVEPVVRESLDRLGNAVLPGLDLAAPPVVGGYWTRTNDPEIDVVLADQVPVARRLLGVGSIKWLEDAPFDTDDLNRLVRHRTQLPGADARTPLLVVTRTGSTVRDVVVHTPETLLDAW